MDGTQSNLKSSASSEAIIGAVAIKLPPFWRNDPEVWFAQAEAQFAMRSITAEETKYHHVIAALPAEVAQDVRDVLINPPKTEPYTTLKEKLTARMTESEQRRVQMLLTEEELGDRKPSQLLRRMKQLMGEQKIENGILKQLFLQRLPQNVRLILASTSESLTLTDLAALADRILEAHIPSVNVVNEAPTVVASNSAAPTSSANAALTEQVAELTNLVRDLSATVRQLQRSRSRSRSRGRGGKAQRNERDSASSSSVEDKGLCWYHARFGENAYRCKPTCTYNTKQGNE